MWDRETALGNAYDFVKPKLLDMQKEKGAVGVWVDAFRAGWDAARRALPKSHPATVTEDGPVVAWANPDRIKAIAILQAYDDWACCSVSNRKEAGFTKPLVRQFAFYSERGEKYYWENACKLSWETSAEKDAVIAALREKVERAAEDERDRLLAVLADRPGSCTEIAREWLRDEGAMLPAERAAFHQKADG